MIETSIVEVGASLELCSCSWKLCESCLQKLFNKNNYPLVQFHCIIKIMCQGLPLGCLQCLLVCAVQDRNFGCRAWILIFYWNVKWFWFFLKCLSVQIVYCSQFWKNFSSIRSMVNVQIATDCSLLDRFCFWCIVCLFWWNYQFISVD